MPTTITIEKGATLGELAKQYKTTTEEIMKANPKYSGFIKDPTGGTIYADTDLIIPTAPVYGGTTPYGQPAAQTGVGEIGQWIDPTTGLGYSGPKKKATDISTSPTVGKTIGGEKKEETLDTINTDINKTIGDLFTGAEKEGEGEEPKRKSAELLEKITEGITTETEAPAKPEYVETYKGLLTKYGTEPLETEIGGLDKQIADLQTQFKGLIYTEEGKPILSPLITGRVQKYAEAYNRLVQPLIDQRNYKAGQLTNKYNTISTLMNLTGKDYEASRGEYEFNFNKQISLYTVVSGLEEKEQTIEDKKRDDARANINIITNAMKSGNISYDNLSDANKLQLQKLSLQAGFPDDFLSVIIPKISIKADIVGTFTNDAGDVNVLTRDKDGNFDVETILKIGKTGGPEKITDLPDDQQVFINRVQSSLNNGDIKYDKAVREFPSIAKWLKP